MGKKAVIKIVALLVVAAVIIGAVFLGIQIYQKHMAKNKGLITSFVFLETTDTAENRFSFDARTMQAVAQRTPTGGETQVTEYNWTAQDQQAFTDKMVEIGVTLWKENYTDEESLVAGGTTWSISFGYADGSTQKSGGYHFTPKNYSGLILAIQELYPRQLVSGADYQI